MQGKTIALLEARVKDQLAELVVKQGGKPFSAPALSEVPDLDIGYIARLIREWRENPAKAVIFQTGVGTRALFNAADSLGLTDTLQQLLAQTMVVVRGPKPTTVLRSRNVRIDLSAAEPFTTAEVMDALDAVPIRGERVVVQRYGEANVELEKALQFRGATVIEIPTYRWALPENTQPLIDLIGALERGGDSCCGVYQRVSSLQPVYRGRTSWKKRLTARKSQQNAGCFHRPGVQQGVKRAWRKSHAGTTSAQTEPVYRRACQSFVEIAGVFGYWL